MGLKSIIMYRNDKSGVPGAEPVSDSSASSNDFQAVTCLDTRKSNIPLEVGGEKFREQALDTKKRVSFGDVEVQKYPVILGDHPECGMGPPLTIGWEPFKAKRASVDDYENKRGPRRSKDELQMGWIQRKQTLRSLLGMTDEEMHKAASDAQRIRDQRNRSRRMLSYEFLQLPFESFNRKIKRAIGRKT